MHPRGIAEEVGLTVEQVRAALDTLEAADEESRSPELDGRRIVRMDEHRAWGWHVVNYVKYRSIRDEDDRREQNRLSQERWRNKHKPPSEAVSHDKPRSAHTEAEAYTDTEQVKTLAASPLPARSPKAPSPAPVPFDGLNSEAIAAKACVVLSASFELPDAWGLDALALGWSKHGALKESERFRQYWVSGKGAGKRKSMRGWRQAWSNWLGKSERINGVAA